MLIENFINSINEIFIKKELKINETYEYKLNFHLNKKINKNILYYIIPNDLSNSLESSLSYLLNNRNIDDIYDIDIMYIFNNKLYYLKNNNIGIFVILLYKNKLYFPMFCENKYFSFIN